MDEWGPVPGLQGAVVTAGRVPGGGFMGGRLWRMGQVWVPPTPTKWGEGCLAGPAPQRSWALSRLALLSQDLWTEIVGD